MSTMTLRNSMTRKGASFGSGDGTMEEFAKAVYTSLTKVINNKEVPPKQKHIRIAVMSTHRERGASTYWSIVSAMGLQSHDVTAYKFCLVTHNVLRDGHPAVLVDSLRHIPFIDTLSRLWSNMADGYGRTTAYYCDLIVTKLKFHERNPLFPGTLQFENISTFEEEYDSHPDNLFNLCAELFDYLEAILTLQKQIFDTISRGRWSTASAQTQCFLSPLVPVIQDACQLYDLIVRSLYKLHSTLPADFLMGHVDRFKKLFPMTKTFFAESARLTYVKSFMHLPSLSVAPDFSRVAQTSGPPKQQQHYAPVQIIKQPANEPTDYDYYYEDDSSSTAGASAIGGTLIDIQGDTSPTPTPPPLLPRGTTGPDVIPKRSPPEVPPLPPQLQDMYQPPATSPQPPVSPGVGVVGGSGASTEMQAEIDYLMSENEQLRERQRQQEEEMNRQIQEIQDRFIQLRTENQQLKKASAEAEARADQLSDHLAEQEQMYTDKLRASAEKFNKITEIYTKLREDHLKVLRAKGELQKQLNAASESNMITLTDTIEKQQAQQEENDRMRVEVSQLNRQIAEMEAQSSEHNSIINQTSNQLNETHTKLAYLNTQLQISHRLSESLLGAIQTSVSTALDVENPTFSIQIEKSDDLVTLVQSVIDSWRLLTMSSNESSDVICFVMRTGDSLYLIGIVVASILQFLPITSSVRNSLCLYSSQCRDMFVSFLDTIRHTSDGSLSVDQLKQATVLVPNQSSNGEEEDESGSGDSERSQQELSPECLMRLLNVAQELKNDESGVGVSSEIDLEQILEDEMRTASRAVDEASNKFQELLKLNSEENSGVKLQVHSSLIASCSKLINVIKQLMLAVRTMQQELVESGAKSSSGRDRKDFYAKNSSWTEGLISGGKSLGLSANMLVETADAAMKGNGRFVAINACAKGIVSAIAHLVLACRVQQQSSTQSVTAANQVASLAKQVQAATGEVIAASQQAQNLEDNSSLMDFSGLNLHQAKQAEMESHIKLMELEASVERERAKLGDLRKHHYKLAAAAAAEQGEE
ncbi:huntington interacting protein related 1-like isoform X2 [Convolutriloba macropyga]|uniref:huntington interacting protein related 1-like isoform X2 n=1 Tax=Convolutriloba macropyga TaxID=536237 RepID=UPI003F521BFA